MFLVGSGGGSRAPENRQVGIPVSGGQLRRFPGALYLDDLLVDPDEPAPRPSEAVLAVGGDGGALGEGDEYLNGGPACALLEDRPAPACARRASHTP
jgi:hypothetical protein